MPWIYSGRKKLLDTRIHLKSPSTVYFSVVTNIDPLVHSLVHTGKYLMTIMGIQTFFQRFQLFALHLFFSFKFSISAVNHLSEKLWLCLSMNHHVGSVRLLLILCRSAQPSVGVFPSAARRRQSWRCASTCSCGVPTRRPCSWPCPVSATSVRRRTSVALPMKCPCRPSYPTTPRSVS